MGRTFGASDGQCTYVLYCSNQVPITMQTTFPQNLLLELWALMNSCMSQYSINWLIVKLILRRHSSSSYNLSCDLGMRIPTNLLPYLYSVSVSAGDGTITTLQEDQDAAISLPPSLFADLDLVNTTEVGIGFTFYETAALFPLPEGSPSNLTIGSSVIGALVGGQSFSDLQDPVIIFLHLTNQVCVIRHLYTNFCC